MHPVLAEPTIRVAALEVQERLAWAERNRLFKERGVASGARSWSPAALRRAWSVLSGAGGGRGRGRGGRSAPIGDEVAAVPSP